MFQEASASDALCDTTFPEVFVQLGQARFDVDGDPADTSAASSEESSSSVIAWMSDAGEWSSQSFSWIPGHVFALATLLHTTLALLSSGWVDATRCTVLRLPLPISERATLVLLDAGMWLRTNMCSLLDAFPLSSVLSMLGLADADAARALPPCAWSALALPFKTLAKPAPALKAVSACLQGMADA